MADPVKIDSLEIENVKRVKAVALEPAKDGLTVIGGRNGQGKTSVLDAICWALGGERMRPARPKRDGAATDPRLKVVLDNGIVVERRGRNGSLKVTDPSGRKGGQKLLDSFVGQLALDLPRFLNDTDKGRAECLLQILGIGDELARLEHEEASLYEQRKTIGQMARQKRGAADELPFYPEAPGEEVSATELVLEQQAILARNGENQRLRDQVGVIDAKLSAALAARGNAQKRVAELRQQLADAEAQAQRIAEECMGLRNQLASASKSAEELVDESTAEIEASIAAIDGTNAKVRANRAHRAAEMAAEELESQYRDMDAQVEAVRARRMALLDGADLPIEGLGVEGGALTYQGQPWGNMSGSEQLRVATAIVRRLKPECGFVLVDKLEQMDPETLSSFAAWAADEGLQVIGTRVGTGGECSIVIEDGYAAGSVPEPAAAETEAAKPVTPPWAVS